MSRNGVLSGVSIFCVDIDPGNRNVWATAYITIKSSEEIVCFYMQTSDPPASFHGTAFSLQNS